MSPKHPTPTLENITGCLRRARCESDWGCIDENAEKNVTLCRFKQQFDVIPCQYQYQDQCSNRNSSIGTDTEDNSDNGVKVCEF